MVSYKVTRRLRHPKEKEREQRMTLPSWSLNSVSSRDNRLYNQIPQKFAVSTAGVEEETVKTLKAGSVRHTNPASQSRQDLKRLCDNGFHGLH